MLFQPTNIIPDTRTGIGFGVVDVSHGMQVSWQVNGDYPVMTAFKIVIYQNNAASTQLYDTGRLTTGCPFAGRNELGEVEFFTYTIPSSTLSSAGITNGNEYKMVITQYYTGDNYSEESITQSSASVFITRSTPNFAWQYVSNVTAPTFTFNFQLTGNIDHLDWVQYQIRPNGEDELIYDSGKIYSPASYSFTCNTLAPGVFYQMVATGQTLEGVEVKASNSFTTASPSAAISGAVSASLIPGRSAVWLDLSEVWESEQTADFNALTIYREQDENPVWQMIDPDCSSYSLVDYGVPNGTGPYRYHIFGVKGEDSTTTPPTPMHIVTTGIVTDYVCPVTSAWSLIVCRQYPGYDYMAFVKEFRFANNLSASSFSNNNEPSVMQNFTAFPTVQLSPSNYKSGTLTALIGRTNMGRYEEDTFALREEIMGLSTPVEKYSDGTIQARLFLKSPKGDVMEIAINGPISAEILGTVKGQPQSVSVPWVEIDNSPVGINSYLIDLED